MSSKDTEEQVWKQEENIWVFDLLNLIYAIEIYLFELI